MPPLSTAPQKSGLKALVPMLGQGYAQLFFQQGFFWQVFFWALCSGVMMLILSLLLFHYAPINSLEAGLLDLKMRYRVNNYNHPSLTPDRNIVILGIDGNTDQYIRLHPEAGLHKTLPRHRLANVVGYLNRQEVKAIVFDLEFKDPKPGDAALANAVSKTPYVYSAAQMHLKLEPFSREQLQPLLNNEAAYGLDIFMEKGVFTPYLQYLANINSRFMPWKTVGPLDIGAGPFFWPLSQTHPPPAKGAPISPLAQITQSLNRETAQHNRTWGNHPLTPIPAYTPETYQNMVERAFSQLCLHENYQRAYHNNPAFLNLLIQQRLPLSPTQPIPDAIQRNSTYCHTLPIIPSLIPHLSGMGSSSVDYDEDAYLRSITALYKGYGGNYYTYLGIRPALDLLDIQHMAYSPRFLYLDDRAIPLYQGHKVMVNWRNPRLLVEKILRDEHIDVSQFPDIQNSLKQVRADRNNPMLNGGHLYRQVSMIDVLNLAEGKALSPDARSRMRNIPFMNESGPFSFKDKIVIIGDTLTDIHRTPVNNTTFGPEIVASTLDMFLHDRVFVTEVPWGWQWGLVIILAIAIGAAIITFDNLAIGFAAGMTLITLYWLGNLMAFVYFGLWGTLILPSVVLGGSMTSATLYRYYIHDQEKHHLTAVFSNYVSPQIMSEIVKNPAKAMDNLKGGKKELTVLFSDLQGFTQQFENTDPELMVNQLNEYFEVMIQIVLKNGGTYDKYMGDSIMAFFGAPTDVPDHAKMACKTAVQMQNALQVLNQNWAKEGRQTLAQGIGISSGEMFVGNFGSRNIKNFTVMGSNVNLGSRLEAYTRVAQWPIIISARTFELAQQHLQAKNLGRIQVKGFTHTLQIYGVEGVEDMMLDTQQPTTPD
ncbi:CHASE2 domain-containing protein [Vampirovibrio sp.]|uniref:CHASE2 domain-containing protein n=1 Tax=Vampirovibrio sp. TaxID=2717857 RepID=UPI003593716A